MKDEIRDLIERVAEVEASKEELSKSFQYIQLKKFLLSIHFDYNQPYVNLYFYTCMNSLIKKCVILFKEIH